MKRSGTSRRPHVVPSQRRDVGSTNTTFHKQQRRNVATSRCGNVATLVRDLPSIIKSSKSSELEASGGVRTRAQNSRAAATPTSKKCP